MKSFLFIAMLLMSMSVSAGTYVPSDPICECGEGVAWCDGSTPSNYTYNMDINTLNALINRFIYEAGFSESANVHTITGADETRFNAFLGAIRKKQAWIDTAPVLDTSHTSPRKYCLFDDSKVPAMANDGIRELIRILEVMRDSLVRSDSSRQGNGLNDYDDARLTDTIVKTQLLLDEIVQPGADYISSAPMVNMVPPGAIGPRKVKVSKTVLVTE